MTGWVRSLLSLTFVATLLGLGLANIALRATWNEVEDGVLWVTRPRRRDRGGRRARRARAPSRGLRAGDVLLAIDAQSDPAARRRRRDAARRTGRHAAQLHASSGLSAREVRQVRLAPLSRGNTALYYVLAAVGIFTLIVGAAVRFRRPGDEATLHFFWVCLAFFGAFTFSFNGRLDRLDWVFYWADAVSILLLPPLFLHFTLVFPERPRSWVRSTMGRTAAAAAVPAGARPGPAARAVAIARAPVDAKFFTQRPGDPRPRSIRSTCRSVMAPAWPCSVHALSPRALRDRATPAALDRLGHGARRASVRGRIRHPMGRRA